jgi:5'-3' exonuclease
MGIPRFFGWLYKTYPEVLITLQKNKTFLDEGIKVDSYALDVNAIIHPVCQKMYNYGSKPSFNSRLLHRKPRKHIIPSEKKVFFEICKVIEELRSLVNPSKQFILAVDGTAGLSKQTQQRQRRFKSASEKSEKQGFDSNSITTGSEFMYNLSQYMHIFVKKQLETNPAWKNIEVIFSNEKVPGEGEHKIIRHIDKNKDMSYCIHSPDADLVMLTIGLDNPNIYIVRENIYRDIKCEYFIVKVVDFRQKLLKMLRWPSSVNYKATKHQTIYDFILLCFLFGNDFLPNIVSIEVGKDGLDLLMDVYPRVAENHGHLIYRSKDTNEICLNTKSLSQLFYALAGKEKQLLSKKAKEHIKFPDELLISCLTKTIGIDSRVTKTTLDFNKFKEVYYQERLAGYDSSYVCHQYFKGLLFVIRYYIDKIPDWHWYYPLNFSPLFVDMYQSIEKFNGEMIFEQNEPLSSFEQLLAVLPPQSKAILPLACQRLLTDDDSPIIDFYPLKFEIDLQGKRMEWEGKPLLPFIDVARLKSAYKNVECYLSDDEKKRTKVGKEMKYFRNNQNMVVSAFLS